MKTNFEKVKQTFITTAIIIMNMVSLFCSATSSIFDLHM